MNRQGMVRSSGYRSPSVPAACVDVRTFNTHSDIVLVIPS